jgi:general secretion pathway protein K
MRGSFCASRRGFALMAALWLLVAISAVSLELSVLARSRRLAAANSLEGMRARAAAESGIEHARARLARRVVEGGDGGTWNDPVAILDPWHGVDSTLRDSVVMDDGAAYRISVADLGAKLNLNQAGDDDLRRYFTAKSVDAVSADALAQAIADWRDADDFRRLRGAERDDYLKAEAPELPRNGPFESVDELRFVKGMTPGLLAKIRDDLTVFGSGLVNVNSANSAVLVSVPGITPLAAEIIVGARAAHRRIESIRQLTDLLPTQAREPLERAIASAAARLTFDTHEVEVRSEGWIVGSPVHVREEAVLVRGGSTAVVTWRRID